MENLEEKKGSKATESKLTLPSESSAEIISTMEVTKSSVSANVSREPSEIREIPPSRDQLNLQVAIKLPSTIPPPISEAKPQSPKQQTNPEQPANPPSSEPDKKGLILKVLKIIINALGQVRNTVVQVNDTMGQVRDNTVAILGFVNTTPDPALAQYGSKIQSKLEKKALEKTASVTPSGVRKRRGSPLDYPTEYAKSKSKNECSDIMEPKRKEAKKDCKEVNKDK